MTVIIDDNDIGKNRSVMLMDLIYESNGIRVPLDKIKFGIPKEVDQRVDLDDDPNTFIPVRVDPQYDDRFALGTSGIMYRRRSISQHVEGIDLFSIRPLFLPFKISDILEEINLLVPYKFQLEEIENYEYKTLEEVEAGIQLVAKKQAYLWFGGKKFNVNTTIISGDPLISNTVLDGFKVYQ